MAASVRAKKMAKLIGNESMSVPTCCSTWSEVEAIIDELAAKTPGVTQDTVENAHRFTRFASGRYETPTQIGVGYWPTIRLTWSSTTPPIEIEIFQDNYEYYGFSEGATDIQHMNDTSGFFPDALKLILDKTISR